MLEMFGADRDVHKYKKGVDDKMSSKKVVYFTNHSASILQIVCLKLVWHSRLDGILLLTSDLFDNNKNLVKRIKENKLFESIIPVKYKGLNEESSEIAQSIIIGYYDSLLKDYKKDEMEIYVVPDIYNPIGIWASVNNIEMHIVSSTPDYYNLLGDHYNALVNAGIANKHYSDLQIKYNVLGTSPDVLNYNNTNLNAIINDLSDKQKQLIMSLYDVGRDNLDEKIDYLLITNSPYFLKMEVNRLRKVINTDEISVEYYNRIYLDILNYLSDGGKHVYIKPHPMSIGFIQPKYYKKSTVMGLYPIELLNLGHYSIDSLVEFGSSSGNKVSDIAENIADYGPFFYNSMPFIHQFMIALNLLKYINNTQIITNFGISNERMKLFLSTDGVQYSKKVSINTNNDVPTSFLIVRNGTKSYTEPKTAEKVYIYINYNEKDISSKDYIEIKPVLKKKENVKPYHEDKHLKSIYVCTESKVTLNLLLNYKYHKSLYYTDEDVVCTILLRDEV